MTIIADDPENVLIQAFCRGRGFPHSVQRVRLVETHISWVLLTGEFAYKIKRPVAPGFLDFSTLALRHAACLEELRINRRLAPDLYLAVVPITGTHEKPVMGGDGPAIEYAVQMREFPADALLTTVVHAGRLTASALDDFAQRLAEFHERLEPAPADSGHGTPAAVLAPIEQSLAQIRELLGPRASSVELEKSERFIRDCLRGGTSLIEKRRSDGRVRECHGDLHLGNLVLLPEGIIAFDALEFDPALRWIDVMGEVAFLVMDLLVRGQRALAWQFLNRYLQAGGDYGGLGLLALHLASRALVRAKVDLLQDRRPEHGSEPDAAALLRFAANPLDDPRPLLILMCGVSGSGKSWLAERLAPLLCAVHVRSDIERKRLAGLPALADSRSPPGGGIYGADASAATYARLGEAAGHVLGAGLPVIIDAASLTPAQREPLIRRAREHGCPAVIVHCRGSRLLLEERIAERRRQGRDPSEADAAVLADQLTGFAPPSAAEGDELVVVDADAPLSPEAVVAALREVRMRR